VHSREVLGGEENSEKAWLCGYAAAAGGGGGGVIRGSLPQVGMFPPPP
jgi:hypothetical protein